MIKRIVVLLVTAMFFVACSGAARKQGFFNDSILVELEVNPNFEGFEEGFAEISIWKYDEDEAEESAELVREVIVRDIKHVMGQRSIRRYLVNLEEDFESDKSYYVILKVYRDSDLDGEMEVVHGTSLRDDRGQVSESIKEVRFTIK